MRKIISRNPFTGKINKQFDFISNQDLTLKIKKAEQGLVVQSKRSLQERGNIIEKVGQIIQKKQRTISEIITSQMGKPISQSEGQVKKVINFCKYYAKNFEPLLPINIKADAKKKTLIKFKPLGIVYYIVPFNFPFYLNFKGGLPNLLAGNCLFTRNADSCPMVGQITEEIMNQAGFDSGQYQNVLTSHSQIDQIFEHNSVGGVSFTGSSNAGSFIAEKAGKYLKKAIMELGGNDPFVVLKDADLETAVKDAVRGRCTNAGQVCFSPKRFIVVQQLYEVFKKKLIENLESVKVGDPMKAETQMGPLARPDLYESLEKQLAGIPKSWKVIYQRKDMNKPFFPITLVEGSDESSDQQMFGPIFSIFKANDQQHALKLANSGSYGLSGSVYSANRGEQFIDQVRCGMGFVNEVAKSDYLYPSGGVGRSGFGRQCWIQGYRSFTNIKLHYEN